MSFLRKTKSFFRDKKSPANQRPPPMPSLSEAPALQTIPVGAPRQTLQKSPDLAGHHITAENIRGLRELIRHKYALDVEIWKQREVKEFARDHCKENMRRSDAALVNIKKTLHAWDRREFFASEEEYKKFREIKDRLMSGNKIVWEQTPPWEVVRRHSVPVRAPYEMNGRPPSVVPSYDQRPPAQPYPRSVSDPQSAQRMPRVSHQAPGRRPVPPQQHRVVSAPQHIQRFAAPQKPSQAPQQSYQGSQQSYQAYQPPQMSYQALPPQTVSPRYA